MYGQYDNPAKDKKKLDSERTPLEGAVDIMPFPEARLFAYERGCMVQDDQQSGEAPASL